ncbi:MAG: extracellular solute-binding protein, partial [Lachnospiraceae bacterium]|nr:extracellular solute-binding protein [Lachnospiraceae bacterium]
VPNYMALMEDNGYDINVCRETDGQIYSMVNVNDCFHCKYARKMWVNTNILDQLGMEIPETTDEFIAVCKAFIEKYPDGIAIAGATSGWFTRVQDWLLGAYTFIPSSSYTLGVKDYVVLDTETDKMYTSMSNGRGVDEKMKENWKRKPYYMVIGKEKK